MSTEKSAQFWLGRIPVAPIIEYAHKYQIEPELVMAFVIVESGGNAGARRVESWKYFFKVHQFAASLGITVARERFLQKHAWGLLQVVGSVARELGYTGHLEELLNPKVNLNFGCKKIAGLLEKYGKVEDAIAAYNGGSPRKDKDGKLVPVLQAYTAKVMYHYDAIKALQKGTG